MTLLEVLRVVLGSVFVLFVPGYFLTQALFKRDEIDFLERITLSIVLSMTSVPLLILFSNVVFGVKIKALNTAIIIVIVALISYMYTKYIKRE